MAISGVVVGIFLEVWVYLLNPIVPLVEADSEFAFLDRVARYRAIGKAAFGRSYSGVAVHGVGWSVLNPDREATAGVCRRVSREPTMFMMVVQEIEDLERGELDLRVEFAFRIVVKG